MMESKVLIDRYCRTRAPLNIAKEKKRLPRNTTKTEGRRPKQDFLTNNRNIFPIATKNPRSEAVCDISPSIDSPILSPETSIALDNAEKVVQNALLEIKQLNAAQCRDRARGGIRFQVHELSFEDEDDQLLYVRERVAAKLYAIDSGIEPVEVVRSSKDNVRFLLDLTSNADHLASRLRSLDKADGKSLSNTLSEHRETKEEHTCANDNKTTHVDNLQADKQGQFSGTSVQKKLEGFSIQTRTSVNIERELMAQKLQDVHISPDSSFVQNAPNVGTYRFQYQPGLKNAAVKNRQKIIRIEKESNHNSKENIERNDFLSARQNEVSVEFSLTSETKEIVAQPEILNADMHDFPDRMESCPSGMYARDETVHSPGEYRMEKIDRDGANSIIPTVHNNDRVQSRSRSIVQTQHTEKDDSLPNKDEEDERHEIDCYTTIETRFKDILENYSERKDPLTYPRNHSSISSRFPDPSFEDMVSALDNTDVYQPSIEELDTAISAYNKAIKRIARGIKTVEQFLSDNKIAQFRDAGNKVSNKWLCDNLLVFNKGNRMTLETRNPSCLPKQTKNVPSDNLLHKQKEAVRAPGKAMKCRQPKTPQVQNEFFLSDNYYEITRPVKEMNNPKRQIRKSSRGYAERSRNNEVIDDRECFTEVTNSPTADTSESTYTDDAVNIENVLEGKAELSAISQSHSENSQGNDHPKVVYNTGTTTLKEMLLKMKDSTRTIEDFHTSFQNIKNGNVKKLFETELVEKEMNPEIIRSVIKNLEAYVQDLQDINANPAEINVALKNSGKDTCIQENKGKLVSPVIEEECNSVEKQLNESQANASSSSEKVTKSVKTLIEENISIKNDYEDKKGKGNGSNMSSLSCKKTISLPIHESSRIDNKIDKLTNLNIKSLEEISFIKVSGDCSNDRYRIQDTKISLPKKQSNCQEIKSLQSVEKNSNGNKSVSCKKTACDSKIDKAVIRKEGSPRDCTGEQISTSDDSLRDCPSLSTSSNTKQPSHKSSNKISGPPPINSNSVQQDTKTDSHTNQAEGSVFENICGPRQNVIEINSKHTNDEKCKQTQPLSEASHSEGEICLSSSCSFSLGEVRRVKTDSRATNSKPNDKESGEILLTHPIEIWNESSDSQLESPGEI